MLLPKFCIFLSELTAEGIQLDSAKIDNAWQALLVFCEFSPNVSISWPAVNFLYLFMYNALMEHSSFLRFSHWLPCCISWNTSQSLFAIPFQTTGIHWYCNPQKLYASSRGHDRVVLLFTKLFRHLCCYIQSWFLLCIYWYTCMYITLIEGGRYYKIQEGCFFYIS